MKAILHIPVAQYGFLELSGDETELPKIWERYNEFAEKPLPGKAAPTTGAVEVTTFTGERILWDAVNHDYFTLDGKKMMGGSTYAKMFEEPFEKDRILAATARKLKVKPEEVDAAWEARGDMARTFGHAIHKSLDAYFKYKHLGYGVSKHPFLANVVESFPMKDADIKSELMVSDARRLMVGQIDALLILGEKKAIVMDYKTDAGVGKNIEKHQNQLSFYSHILMAFGWDIQKVIIWNYTTKWESYESPVLPLKGGLK
jgi:hypothetical protein